MARQKLDIAQILLRKGTITAVQLKEAQEHGRTNGLMPEEALVKMQFATSDDVAEALAQQQGLKYADLKKMTIPPDVVELVPESVAREHTLFPIKGGDGQLTLAMVNPLDFELLDKLRFVLNRRIEIAVASREAITAAINRYYSSEAAAAGAGDEAPVFELSEDFTKAGEELAGGDDDVNENSAPVVRLVQLMIQEAVQMRASDIHIEPFEDRVRVRYRIDGVLVERDSAPRRLLGPILSRVKILSKLDIAERRRTQDGRIKVSTGEKELDLRVSVIPTVHGQSVVARILDKASIRVGLKQLGFAEDDYRTFATLIRRPNGIILVTGPTGSGKTTSLYAALNELNTPDRKVITAEDPVEYYLEGINQVEVRHEIGLDFARIIRAMLRQAPNVILVGEMRDLETAQMGIQASLTGHLVFSTLHTNDAPSAVTRLIDMGVPSYLVASSVIAIMAQRLVRIVCPKSRQPYSPPKSAIEAAGITPEMAAKANFMKGKGCGYCNGKGYRGRLGIFELMLMSSKIRELTFQEAPTEQLRRVAVSNGMRTLYWDGIEKVLRGQTTLEEVLETAKRQDDE